MSENPTLRDFYSMLGDGQGLNTAATELAEADNRATNMRVDALAALERDELSEAGILAQLALADEVQALRHTIAAAAFERPERTNVVSIPAPSAPSAPRDHEQRAFGEGVDLTDPGSFASGAFA